MKERDAAIARAERAEGLLAALWTAATAACDSLGTGVGSDAIAKTAQLGRVLADTAAAAEAYRERIEAPLRAEIERLTAERDEARSAHDEMVMRCGEAADYMKADDVRVAKAEAERDALAAALAEVQDADREYDAAYYALNSTHAVGSPEADAVVPRMVAATERRKHALTALPADLAAERFRRERAEALEAAADAIERGSVLSQYGAHGWLRARAADERGGR